MIIKTPPQPIRRKHGSPEARIQSDCFIWTWNNYPETRRLFFHVANEVGENNAMKGQMMRAEGVIAGVSDMILFLPRHGYHAWCCEFKTATGRQSEAQVSWQALVESKGYKYDVCRSLEEFQKLLTEYLNG